jgi:hypothetical protein
VFVCVFATHMLCYHVASSVMHHDTLVAQTHTHTHTHTRTRRHTYMYTHTCTHVHTRTCTHTHTHTHTHKHTHMQLRWWPHGLCIRVRKGQRWLRYRGRLRVLVSCRLMQRMSLGRRANGRASAWICGEGGGQHCFLGRGETHFS